MDLVQSMELEVPVSPHDHKDPYEVAQKISMVARATLFAGIGQQLLSRGLAKLPLAGSFLQDHFFWHARSFWADFMVGVSCASPPGCCHRLGAIILT